MKHNLIGISGKIGSGKDTVGKIIQYLNHREFQNKRSFQLTGSYTNSGYKIKKFADKLKDIVCLLIGCTREQLEDREFKERELSEEWNCYYPTDTDIIFLSTKDSLKDKPYWKKRILTPRKLLQLLGTEAGRRIIHPNIWVNSLFAEYIEEKDNWYQKNIQDTSSKWIITDVRFPNEVKAIKDRGGIVIRVNRDLNKRFNLPHAAHFRNPAIESYESWFKRNRPEDYKKSIHKSEIALDDYKDWDHIIDNNGSIKELIEKLKVI